MQLSKVQETIYLSYLFIDYHWYHLPIHARLIPYICLKNAISGKKNIRGKRTFGHCQAHSNGGRKCTKCWIRIEDDDFDERQSNATTCGAVRIGWGRKHGGKEFCSRARLKQNQRREQKKRWINWHPMVTMKMRIKKIMVEIWKKHAGLEQHEGE